MITAVVFAPQPPLLIPEVASGAASELDELRASLTSALAAAAAVADRFAIVGTVPGLAIGSWLLSTLGTALASVHGEPELLELTPQLQPAQCARAGADFAASAIDPTALLVMGDGSACRSEKAPGYIDERALGFDEAIAAALGTADLSALAGLDPQLASELLAAGRPAWQFAAAAAAGSATWSADLLFSEAPYGVAYFAALWTAS